MIPKIISTKQIGNVWIGVNEFFIVLSYKNRDDAVFISHDIFEQIIQWYHTGETKEDMI